MNTAPLAIHPSFRVNALPLICALAFITPALSLFSPLALAPCYMLLAIIPLCQFIASRDFSSLYNTRTAQIILAFLALSLISSTWALVPRQSLVLWLRMVLFFVSFMALLSWRRNMSPAQTDLLGKALVAGLGLALVLAAIEMATNGILSRTLHFYNPQYYFRLTDLNRGSVYLAFLVWPALAFLLHKGKRVWAGILLLACLGIVCRLDSQSAMLGLVTGVGIWLCISKFQRAGIIAMMLITLSGIIIIPPLASWMNAPTVAASFPTIPGAASQMRLYIWDYAAKRASEHYALGWGFNTARSIPVPTYDYVLGGRHPLPLHPHNSVLQMWLELGIAGLVLFSLFALSLLQTLKTLAVSQLSRSLGAGLFAAYFLVGLTGFGIWQNWLISGGLISVFLWLIASETPSTDSVRTL